MAQTWKWQRILNRLQANVDDVTWIKQSVPVSPIGDPVLPLPITAEITPDMFKTLVKTLQHAHVGNIVDRDVKPDNILLDRVDNTRVIVGDWSSAAVMSNPW